MIIIDIIIIVLIPFFIMGSLHKVLQSIGANLHQIVPKTKHQGLQNHFNL